jgi:uncharacterized protein (DUF2141 family)
LQEVDDRRYISVVPGVTAFLMLLVLSCAKISSPTGGPKDTDPPVIVRSVPENGTVMFTGKTFEITFNEYVVLDRISEKFMVSPPLKTKPDVRLKGKSLIVGWDDDLADSTTYTFYFQDAIRDNNENNPIPNYQYVLSTGPVLDSLSLTGNVFGAFDLETVPDVTVMMYSNLSDTAPRKVLPAYISRPDPSGGFLISNIRPGHYRLYALKDLNGNSLYDLDDETFAFCDSIIDITPENYYSIVPDTIKYKPANATEKTPADIFTFGLIRLYAFQQEAKKQYLTYTERRSAWSLGFGLAQPSDSGQVSVSLSDAPEGSWYVENNAKRDTFNVWITDRNISDRDVIEAFLTYPFTDSTGSVISRTDTVSLRYQKPPQPRSGVPKTPALTLSPGFSGRLKPGTVPAFTSSTPLNMPDTSKITFLQVVDTIRTRLVPEFARDTVNSRRIFLSTPLKPGTNYTLICRAGAFSDIFGNKNDSTAYRLDMATEEDYGSIGVSMSGYDGRVIVQLLGDKEKVVKEAFVKTPGKADFRLLDKGRYRLKAIYDLDSNLVWTTGDFGLNREPEPVTYYPGEIEVKINWALEQEWDLGNEYSKDVSLRTKPAAKKQ